MSLIDVALVGGGTLHREGLRQSLDLSHFVVVAEGRDVSSVLTLIGKGVCPRLVIVDVSRLLEKSSRIFVEYVRQRQTAVSLRSRTT